MPGRGDVTAETITILGQAVRDVRARSKLEEKLQSRVQYSIKTCAQDLWDSIDFIPEKYESKTKR